MDALAERLEEVIARLQAIETELHHLREERTVKEWYGTAEVATVLNRSDYTVREWCRKRQIPAEKTSNGRDWIVSHETLVRLKNRELPLPEHQVHGGIQRRRA
jgi:excisionase family DNA binding protein